MKKYLMQKYEEVPIEVALNGESEEVNHIQEKTHQGIPLVSLGILGI